jgi:hypothetical protein
MAAEKEKLPKSIVYGGVTYTLSIDTYDDEMFKDWWSYGYYDENNQPAHVHSKSYWYYLCSMCPTKEKAYNDILEKINDMITD